MIEINKIYHESCLATMQKMDREFIDLVITSPPYDDMRDYKGNSKFDFDGIARQLYRVIKQGGMLIWIVTDQSRNFTESGTSFKQALAFMQLGFNLYDTMIYLKSPKGLSPETYYEQAFEYMFAFSKGKPKTINLLCDRPNASAGSKQKGTSHRGSNDEINKVKKNFIIPEYSKRTNVWYYNPGFGSSSKDKIAYKHPAIFPEELVRDLLRSWSTRGDIIYDPFMGSGTTAKMARIESRNYIGSEVNLEYIQIARQRLMF